MALPKVSAVMPVPSEIKKTVLLGMFNRQWRLGFVLGGSARGIDFEPPTMETIYRILLMCLADIAEKYLHGAAGMSGVVERI